MFKKTAQQRPEEKGKIEEGHQGPSRILDARRDANKGQAENKMPDKPSKVPGRALEGQAVFPFKAPMQIQSYQTKTTVPKKINTALYRKTTVFVYTGGT